MASASVTDQSDNLKSEVGRELMGTLRSALTGKSGLVHLLRYEDRNAMRWSIESRVPFLTTEMAELVLSLPESFLLSNCGETKCIFRAAMRRIAPDEVLDRRDKVGFETPDKKWVRKSAQQLSESSPGNDEIDIFSKEKLTKRIQSSVSDSRSNVLEDWRALKFYRWYKIFFDKWAIGNLFFYGYLIIVSRR